MGKSRKSRKVKSRSIRRNDTSSGKKMYTLIGCVVLVLACVSGAKHGGQQPMDIKEVTESKLLMGGLDKAVEMVNHERKNHYRMVRHSILSAKKQVVSGMLYKVIVHMVESTCENVEENDGKLIEECPERTAHSHGTNYEISMWSRPWIKDPAQSFIIKLKLLLHAENDAGMGGQGVDMDIKEVTGSKLLMGGLDQAMEMMNSNRRNPLRIVRHSILKAKKQVVSGTLYKVTVHFVDSTCKNIKENDGKTIEECPEKEAHSHVYNCVVSMWSRPWIKDPAQSFIVKVKCLRHSPSPLDNTKVGAPVKMDIKEVTGSHLLMEGLDKAVEMMNIERKNHYRMVRHSILAAKKQVVSGMLYKVIVHMVESSCENVEENDGKLIEDCPERVAHSHGTNFEISMWSRPWIKDPAQSFIIKMKLLLHASNDEVMVGGPVKMDIKEVTGSQLLMGGLDKAVEMMNHERKN